MGRCFEGQLRKDEYPNLHCRTAGTSHHRRGRLISPRKEPLYVQRYYGGDDRYAVCRSYCYYGGPGYYDRGYGYYGGGPSIGFSFGKRVVAEKGRSP
jgi:hypothetical protein